MIACGGLGLLVAVALPWDGAAAAQAACAVAGAVGLLAAVTGGRVGFFRPDVSLNGAADMLAVLTAIVAAAALLDGAGTGAAVALAAATAQAFAAGDWSPLRGAPLFPRFEP